MIEHFGEGIQFKVKALPTKTKVAVGNVSLSSFFKHYRGLRRRRLDGRHHLHPNLRGGGNGRSWGGNNNDDDDEEGHDEEGEHEQERQDDEDKEHVARVVAAVAKAVEHIQGVTRPHRVFRHAGTTIMWC